MLKDYCEYWGLDRYSEREELSQMVAAMDEVYIEVETARRKAAIEEARNAKK